MWQLDSITKSCKYPEVAMRGVDWFFSMEGDNMASYGPLVDSEKDLIEGVAGWRFAKEGEVGADGKPALFYPYGLNNEVDVGWQTGRIVPRYRKFEWHTGMVIPGGGRHYEAMLYDTTVNDYWPYSADKTVPSLYMDDTLSSEFAELQSIIKGAVNEAIAQFVTDVRDIDSSWDSYIEDLNRLGLKRYLEIYQGEYNRNYKK